MKTKYKNNVKIEDNYIIKKYNKNILNIYEILDSSSFDNYPKILETTDKYIKYEFIEDTKYYEKTKGEEFIKLVSHLHSKTLFLKEVGKDKYENIYNKLKGNINYLTEYYEEMINEIEMEEYMSPSHYFFARNYSLIDSSLKYSLSTLNKWYRKQNNKTNERVSIVHNKLSLDHFIKSKDKDYLISFEDSVIDTPILDLYKFYLKEGFKLNFIELFKIYNNGFNLLEDEKLLFKTLISIPYKIEETDNEILNITYINDLIMYLNKTAKFINENK